MDNIKITDTIIVILAGGKSRRMGRDKMMLKLGDESVLQSVINRFSHAFEKVYVSVANPEKYPEIKEEKIVDIFPEAGPLAGLHAALKKIEHNPEIGGVFLVAADLPFVTYEDSLRIIELAKSFDICVPVDDIGRYEPLFAYYSKSILPQLERMLEAGEKRVINLYPMVNFTTINTSEFSKKNFYNLNFPEDYNNLINNK